MQLGYLSLPLCAVVGPALAQSSQGDIGVGVELVLAVDISRSINPAEQLIQRQGYAAAFRSTAIQKAILFGEWKRVAVTYVEWAGSQSQMVTIPWTLIDSAEAAEAFADSIEAGSSRPVSRTSISGAIDFASGLFDGNGFEGSRRVIDVSGDGPNNQGRIVTEARDDAVAQGITINGLPLLTGGSDGSSGSWSSIPNLDRYYTDCVIGGTGAFSVAVTSWDQFAAAVRYKLVLEVVGLQPPPHDRLIRIQTASETDCLIGERLWEDRQRSWGE
ncbi:DUF1194 domain-containing protein [Paracoccus aestuariivivens]|uniref:DUF1194 domain-containing protein n=1 Tax=Paracoccus aestuariivivens TaxID=1820333 RepID=A0A6L6J8C3_9RHOB|nr:DUF1194 domain-containing protein [Paracoccus aestuariivivens]MTH76877.1 DUF1194 domain-containing protein [Paracoccus aestuariivivens]